LHPADTYYTISNVHKLNIPKLTSSRSACFGRGLPPSASCSFRTFCVWLKKARKGKGVEWGGDIPAGLFKGLGGRSYFAIQNSSRRLFSSLNSYINIFA